MRAHDARYDDANRRLGIAGAGGRCADQWCRAQGRLVDIEWFQVDQVELFGPEAGDNSSGRGRVTEVAKMADFSAAELVAHAFAGLTVRATVHRRGIDNQIVAVAEEDVGKDHQQTPEKTLAFGLPGNDDQFRVAAR